MSAPKKQSFLSGLLRHQLVIPIAALLLLAIFNLIADPSFFRITLGTNSDGNCRHRSSSRFSSRASSP